MQVRNGNKQQGVALAISLIFLVLITIIGVSSIRGTTINELMSANTQQKSSTYQVSESVIEGVWDTGYLLKNTPAVDVDDSSTSVDETTPHLDAPANDNSLSFNTMFDIKDPDDNTIVKVEVDAHATLQYCGESFEIDGYQKSSDDSTPAFVAHIYSIHGVGEIPVANAMSDHDQRGYLVRSETGRTGTNCDS